MTDLARFGMPDSDDRDDELEENEKPVHSICNDCGRSQATVKSRTPGAAPTCQPCHAKHEGLQ